MRKEELLKKSMESIRRQKEFVQKNCKHFEKDGKLCMVVDDLRPLKFKCRICGKSFNATELRGAIESNHEFYEDHPNEDPDQWFYEYLRNHKRTTLSIKQAIVDTFCKNQSENE